MPKVVVIGEILVEIMADRIGQSFLEAGVFQGPFPSGSPAIFIDQVAKLGVDAGIVASVGADDFGRLNIDRLRADGVDVSRIRELEDETTGVAFVTYRANGDRQFIFHFTHSAAGRVESSQIDHAFLEDVEVLHVMGCSLTTSASMRDTILQAVRFVKSRGKRVSFDPNIRLELISGDQIQRSFEEILCATDILLTGRGELLTITGESDYDKALQSVLGTDLSILVVKSASEGATVYWDGRFSRVPSFKVGEVDPTGAGDCFDGAFVASLLKGFTVEGAVRVANAAGAFSVTKRGPMEGTASLAQLEAFMKDVRQNP